MKRTKRYKINKGSVLILVLLSIVCLICYSLLSWHIVYDKQITNETIAKYETAKSVLVIVISTIGVNLLSGLLIEVRTKNNYLQEIMTDDVVGSPAFYDNMSDEVREKMYEALEASMFSKNKMSSQIYRHVREKLNEEDDTYYYTKCSYSVTCTVYDNYIEKAVTRTTHIRSYEDRITLEDYNVIGYSSKKINGMDSFQKDSLCINGKKIPDSDCEERPRKEEKNLYVQNEYNYSIDYVYKKKLEITSEKDTIIDMKYVTRTSIDDKMSTFRVARPCKEFKLYYTVNQHDKFRLVGSAYGFLDNADDSNNNSSTSNLTIEFSDWIFKHDGATVVMLDKK